MSDSLVDSLRLEGVHEFDPVRFHYIEALAHRARSHQGIVKRILDEKLAVAVSDYQHRFERNQCVRRGAIATTDRALRCETLGDLVRYMADHSSDKADTRVDANAEHRTELKSVRYFRNTWSRLSAEKQVTQALEQAPKNAGPINSHVVALRSLALMRETSPDYLNRFMSYVDTLLRLDQNNKATPPTVKSSRTAKSVKK